MKLKIAVLTLALMYYNNDSNTNAQIEVNKKCKTETVLIEQLKNLSDQLYIDDQSVDIIKKYSLIGKFTKKERDIVRNMAESLNIKEEWLYKLFYLESRGNPKAVNKQTKATGLIQFMPSTARNLNTTVEDLYKMTISEQLIYVEKYLTKVKRNREFNSFLDLYLAVFYPSSINKPINHILGSEYSDGFARKIAKQNKGIDKAGNNDGYITPSDIDEWHSKLLS